MNEQKRWFLIDTWDLAFSQGFFYLNYDGIPSVDQSVVDATFRQADEFFQLPLDEKMKIHNMKNPGFKGYTPLLGENTDP
jgi:isopenicillin N synthase-like dioxygenase